MTQTEVAKVEIEGKSARGIVAHGEQGSVRLPARHVILSAGALLSPTLLLRSGIGPAAGLQRCGVQPLVVREGVGANLQNHVTLNIGVTLNAAFRQDVDEQTFAVACLRFSSGHPDGPVSDMLGSFVARTGLLPHGTRLGMIGVHLYAPASRGSVGLDPGAPDGLPSVDFRFMSASADLERMVSAAGRVLGMLDDPALRTAFLAAFLFPSRAPLQLLNRGSVLGRNLSASLAALLDLPQIVQSPILSLLLGANRIRLDGRGQPNISADLAAQSAVPMAHPVGTCAIGASDDDNAVVDPEGRVYGLDGLSVADASIMPVIPRANTALSTMMVAERAAALIRKRH